MITREQRTENNEKCINMLEHIKHSVVAGEDIYSTVASILFYKDISFCREYDSTGSPYADGKRRRTIAKKLLLHPARIGSISETFDEPGLVTRVLNEFPWTDPNALKDSTIVFDEKYEAENDLFSACSFVAAILGYCKIEKVKEQMRNL